MDCDSVGQRTPAHWTFDSGSTVQIDSRKPLGLPVTDLAQLLRGSPAPSHFAGFPIILQRTSQIDRRLAAKSSTLATQIFQCMTVLLHLVLVNRRAASGPHATDPTYHTGNTFSGSRHHRK